MLNIKYRYQQPRNFQQPGKRWSVLAGSSEKSKIIFLYNQQLQMNQNLTEKESVDVYGAITVEHGYRWTRIIFFEFFAAYIFTYGLMTTYYLDNPKPFMTNPAHSVFISLNMFLVFLLFGQVTGGHGNPLITLALMTRRDPKVSIAEGLVYILTQFVGSLGGAATAYGIVDNYSCAFNQKGFTTGQSFGGEIIGSFLFVFFFLLVITESTTFLKSNYWTYLLVPTIFYGARELSHQVNSLNPAATLANQIFYGIKYNSDPIVVAAWYPLKIYWVYIIGSLIGALLAIVIFNFLYVPIYLRWKARK